MCDLTTSTTSGKMRTAGVHSVNIKSTPQGVVNRQSSAHLGWRFFRLGE